MTEGPKVRIRDAGDGEAPVLEALQRRSSAVWAQYRDQLEANPDAIAVPESFVAQGWVRVAVPGTSDETPLGFSVVIPGDDGVHELDGLFVEPDHMHRGIGRALVEDAAGRAADGLARRIEVTAGPATGFYEKLGFAVIAQTQTRFGPAVRMCRELAPRR
jgi:GNAT superfamily N-acetyltransferase